MALGESRSELMITVLYVPSSLDASMVSVLASVQYKLRAIQSTATPALTKSDTKF